jgi:hypothetical protein
MAASVVGLGVALVPPGMAAVFLEEVSPAAAFPAVDRERQSTLMQKQRSR